MANRDGFRGENDGPSPYIHSKPESFAPVNTTASAPTVPTVYLADPDITLWHGDALETLRGLPDESVHCVVTSPPYWGLRDYGTGLWEGGDPDCDHTQPGDRTGATGIVGSTAGARRGTDRLPSDVCGKCGAHRTDNQMGLEPTPELYVQNMVTVFREVRRVLRRDGTCWLNIGDSYNANTGRGFDTNQDGDKNGKKADAALSKRMAWGKPKDLVGIPWRLAFALQQDGWWLRADIIWAKPNPMPESVTDRPTKAHEYLFLLTRSPRYFFDQEAVREPATYAGEQLGIVRGTKRRAEANGRGSEASGNESLSRSYAVDAVIPAGRNVRSVWEIATEPFPQAHFATFPTELARRCILAGTSERGCCPECGAPWERETETKRRYVVSEGGSHADGTYHVRYSDAPHEVGFREREDGFSINKQRWHNETSTLGWRPTCACCLDVDGGPATEPLRPIPCTVLDPFAGACTVPLVARRHGRHSIGIELSETYLRQIALPRLQQLSLLA